MLESSAKAADENGFTLVELMVTLAVMAILATLAVPSMTSFFDKQRVVEAAEDLYSNIQQARSESIARFIPTYLNFSDGNATAGWQSGASWQYGIGQTPGCDTTITANTDASACYLIIDNGDGATNAADDHVLFRYSNSNYSDVAITSVTDMSITFSPQRGTADASTITLESADGRQMQVVVSALGQVSICSPDGAAHVGGYKAC
jgi:type II secretion system protein H